MVSSSEIFAFVGDNLPVADRLSPTNSLKGVHSFRVEIQLLHDLERGKLNYADVPRWRGQGVDISFAKVIVLLRPSGTSSKGGK